VDLKKYISSGILENYILGLASKEECSDLESNLKLYPELSIELKTIEKALEVFASAHQVKAPAGLEAGIMDKLGFNKTVHPASSTPIAKPSSHNTGFTSLLLAALLCILSLIAAIWFFNQNNNARTELNEVNDDYTTLKSDCETKDGQIQALENKLQILREANNLKVQMNGTDRVPDAIASVIYNPTSKKSYIDVLHLPPPPSDKQYQLWAIVDGAPVDMGVFDVVFGEDTILQEVPFIEKPQAFAVTLEKKGGSPTPTMEEMVVVGNFVAG